MAEAPGSTVASLRVLPAWQGFAVTALGLALVAGFAAGTLTVLARLAGGTPLWPAALAQAHGHVQVYGFAGLMTLGVAQHFVPRLRGVSPPASRSCWLGLSFLGAGLALRVLSQPLLASGVATRAGATALVASGSLELIGGSVVVWALTDILRRPGAAYKRPHRTLTGAFLTGLVAYEVALALNFFGTWQAAGSTEHPGILPERLSAVLAVLGFYGFLLPIAFAMGSRTFPLFFRTQAPRPAVLAVALGLVASGTALRVAGLLARASELPFAGEALLACGVLVGILSLQVFSRRRQLPGAHGSAWLDPLNLLATSAHGWLALVVVALLSRQLPQSRSLLRSPDAEWHLVGVGYVTLLILAVGSHLLPGFGGRRLRWPWVSWALLTLGNAAVVGRLIYALAPDAAVSGRLAAAAGLAMIAALALFALNTGVVAIRRSPRTGSARESAASTESGEWCGS